MLNWHTLIRIFLQLGIFTISWMDIKLLVQLTWSHLTLALSSSLVNMTIVELLCSQTILQKSASVSGSGPYNKSKVIRVIN